MADSGAPTCGFVYAATGPLYATLARRAARTLKAAMPGAAVDLFTDQAVDDPVFDRIAPVEAGERRPKMAALARSRFDRTVFLDADTMVLADVSDLFSLLDRFDFAATHGQRRDEAMYAPLDAVPRAFPSFNSGVIALRRSERTLDFLHRWIAARDARREGRDQPSLRSTLWQSDLRIMALPQEYNAKFRAQFEVWNDLHGAPRILHESSLHKTDPGDPETPFTIEEMVGKVYAPHVRALIASDWSLGGDGTAVPPPIVQRRRKMRALRTTNKKLRAERTRRGNAD